MAGEAPSSKSRSKQRGKSPKLEANKAAAGRKTSPANDRENGGGKGEVENPFLDFAGKWHDAWANGMNDLLERQRGLNPFLNNRHPERVKPQEEGCPPTDVEPAAKLTSVDRLIHVMLGQAMGGVSPASLGLAWMDWSAHLAMSPGKQAHLMEKAQRKLARLALRQMKSLRKSEPQPPCIQPLPHDRRFDDPAWREPPFDSLYQSFLLMQQWWHNATTDVRGASKHSLDMMNFMSRQVLDMYSPSNNLLTNPELLKTTMEEGGDNLWRGFLNAVEDWERTSAGHPPVGAENYRPGKTVAITEGEVVYRNRLIELIQYKPTTEKVGAEPVLIVPAWIMKYYILDLEPQNSLVKYLVDRGHTVFMISWKNPTAEDRDLSMDDYLDFGIMKAVKAVEAIMPDRKIDAVGYCLGGTLLSIAAAYMGRNGDGPLNSVTLFAAQTDFSEAGELKLFIDDSQLTFLDDLMWDQGYLDTKQMAGAFHMLRSQDLIWSRLVHENLMGERAPMNALMAWNADATRMPYHMHSEYLRHMFLNNDLFEGRYEAFGHHVSLSDIRAPLFVVSTETDHVAPWKSVYKINLVADVPITFVLTSGGHNAGIVSEPGHPHRHFRISTREASQRYLSPESWLERTPVNEGSWWPGWVDWLDALSSGRTEPPSMGLEGTDYAPITPAPGHYVLQT
ncbi:polyhydroxyalkanoate synthase [Parvibaculum indicum]|uniref:PHA/PHB synthase family protein n=1 Tax=Parvibaculum indicum TaxID=562969 RepID=UPI001FE69270|nr:alpha/beta fold hydrolase [Parvibaculum indicum]NIJ40865.1 polyhydroxyalkanoate synthase [Parvibaculum indicum]